MRRQALIITMAMALLLALAAPSAAASPHQVDPGSVTPLLNPNLAPWTCWRTGQGIICEGSVEGTYENEDFDLRCGDQVIWVSGSFSDRVTRWHTADGRATKTFAIQSWQETWSLSLDGTGPTLQVRSRSIRHYTYHVPGDLAARQLTETGSTIIATAPGVGIVFRDAGRITYALGAENDFANPVDFRGPHDTWFDWDGAVARACAILEG